MWPLAIFLTGVVLFFWLAACLTAWAWLNALSHLLLGNFTRAAAWFAVGVGLLFWWFDEHVSFDEWWQMSLLFVVLGALATFAKLYNRHQRAAQAAPPFEPAPFEPTLNINIKFEVSPHADRRAVHDDLAAIASALRSALGTEQSPRRITGPTIIDQ